MRLFSLRAFGVVVAVVVVVLIIVVVVELLLLLFLFLLSVNSRYFKTYWRWHIKRSII